LHIILLFISVKILEVDCSSSSSQQRIFISIMLTLITDKGRRMFITLLPLFM